MDAIAPAAQATPVARPQTAINAAEARARIDSATPPFLLDVREPYEYAEGHIDGARLLPLGELGRRLNELPQDREILVICRSGNRSGTATREATHRLYIDILRLAEDQGLTLGRGTEKQRAFWLQEA